MANLNPDKALRNVNEYLRQLKELNDMKASSKRFDDLSQNIKNFGTDYFGKRKEREFMFKTRSAQDCEKLLNEWKNRFIEQKRILHR